jgi:NAD(P)-dependent dehydrogenase (short-subunit alcohol dehydrogenase family)
MSWNTSDIPDQRGRVAVVTGANGGLGLETAKALAGAGAHVVMAARNQEKAAIAAETIRSAVPDASLEVVPLDLGSLESVRAAAAQIAAAHRSIDLLVNNAGVMGIPERVTDDGFEMQFGTNHLGHFALTALLLPSVLRAGAPRVVTVTSTARHMGRAASADNPHLHDSYGEWKAYGQSKLANYHFAIGLQQRFESAGARAASLTAHPGLSNTDLQTVSVEETGGGFSQKFFHSMAEATGMSAAQGALPQLRAATDPAAKGGELYAPMWVTNGPPVKRPILRRIGMDSAIASLWKISEAETGVVLDVPAAMAAAASD